MNDNDFEATLERVRAGDELASAELFEAYSPLVRRVVRRQLNPRFRRRLDSDDFIQSVWRSLFVSAVHKHAFTDPQAFVAFLCEVTRRKVVSSVRRNEALRADINREVSLHSSADVTDDDEIDPAAGVVLDEQWSTFLNDLGEEERHILNLRLEGLTFEQISGALNVPEWTIRRVFRRVLAKVPSDAE